MGNKVKERILPEKALELLKDDGINVTIEEAKVISDFLHEMAEIVVNQYLSSNKNS